MENKPQEDDEGIQNKTKDWCGGGRVGGNNIPRYKTIHTSCKYMLVFTLFLSSMFALIVQ